MEDYKLKGQDKENITAVLTYEQKQKQAKEKRFKEHKCTRCGWGTWTGTKYVCLFPRCIKF